MAEHEAAGIRFNYPDDWEVEETDDGSRTTLIVQSPGGLAFALVTVDEDRPEAEELVTEAIEALRGDYPNLEVTPAEDQMAGRDAVGFDVAFISLDLTNAGMLRSVRTADRTLFFLGQWSEVEADDDPEALIDDLFRSIEEADEA